MVLLLVACSEREPVADASGWRAEPVDDLVLAQRLVADGRVGPATASCTAAAHPLEHHVGSTARVEYEGIALFGLLAETAYLCDVVGADGRPATVSFTTEPLPSWLPTWHLEEAAGGDAYTILNHGTDDPADRQSKVLIIDPDGALRWYVDVPFEAPDLDVSYLGGGQILYGGGYAAPPTVVGLAGEVVRQAVEADIYHHHAEQLADGTFAALTVDQNTDGASSWMGMEIEVLDPEMLGTVWSWRTQRGVDEGWLPVPVGGNDPYHVNAIAFEDTAVYANFRNLSILVKLDRETGDRLWTLGAGGDFALLDAEGAPADDAGWFYGAHAPEHDGDRILLHDNGFGREGPLTSRIAEFAIDEVARTAQVTWEYTEPGWYEPIWGDVDRLPDGHVLFTRAHCGACRADDPDFTQIVELDPETLAVTWRLVFDDGHDAGYRSERIDGCDLFGNTRFCGALGWTGSAP